MLSWKNKKIGNVKNSSQLFSNITAYAILVVALGSITFFGVCDPTSFQPGNSVSGPVVRLGDDTVSQSEFGNRFENIVQMYGLRSRDGGIDPSFAERIVENIVREVAISDKASRMGLMASEEEIEDRIYESFVDPKTGKFNNKLYEQVVKSGTRSEASMIKETTRRIQQVKLQELATGWPLYAEAFAKQDQLLAETKLKIDFVKISKADAKVSVTAADIAEFLKGDGLKKAENDFKANEAALNKPAKTKASHILITHKDSQRPSDEGAKRTKDEARKIAESVLAEAGKPGADFAALAKKYTDEATGKEKGGDLGFFDKNAMVKPFSDAAFALKKGEISQIVETDFGYHIIKVTDRVEAVVKTFDTAKNEIAEKLIQEAKAPEVLQRRAEAILADLKGGTDAKQITSRYGITMQTSDEFSLKARAVPGLGSDEKLIEAVENLKIAGEIHPQVIDVGELKVIVRLNARKNAPDTLSSDELQKLARDNNDRFYGSLYSNVIEADLKKLKEDKKIFINEEFLASTRTNVGG
jgi:peptidyl-prolyl cis-trans isomerase D